MTQKNEAPPRFWIDWRPGLAVTNGPLAGPPRTEVYRADHALALVAAERETVADMIENMPDNEHIGDEGETLWAPPYQWDVADQIRARTDADAQNALDRVKREARDEALIDNAVLNWACEEIFDLIEKDQGC